MNKSFFIIQLLLSSLISFGQNKTDTSCYHEKFDKREDDSVHVFTKLEIQAEFKRGDIKWRDFIQKNISFKKILRSLPDSITYFQDSAIIKFIVSKEGILSNFEIVYAGSKEIENETVRLLKLSSCNWKPGINGNRLLNSWHIEPLYFIIEKNNETIFTGFRVGFLKKVYASDEKQQIP